MCWSSAAAILLRRDTLKRMAQIYAQRFADPDGKVRATFEIIWLSGWAPHESQQKPLRPGSAQTRLADALGVREISTGEKPERGGGMNDTASALTHASRANIFQTEARWRLGADALVREGGEPANAPWYAHAARIFLRVIWPWTGIKIEPGGAARFPYAGITELRLSFDPTRFDTRRHRCDVR